MRHVKQPIGIFRAKPSPHFSTWDMMATPKEKNVPHLPGSAITITKSGRLSRSPKRYGHSENSSRWPGRRVWKHLLIEQKSSLLLDYNNILQSSKMTSPIHQKMESHECSSTMMISQPKRDRRVDWLDFEKKMQVLSSMRCGGSLTYPKKVLRDRVK